MNKLILLFSLFFSFQLFAQDAVITGTVKDAKGNPLSGASVQIQNSYTGTFTNASGQFNLLVSPGVYNLETSYMGYVSQKQTVSVAQKSTIDIVLQESQLLLQQVVVSAVKAGEFTPVAKTEYSKADISSKINAQDIPLLLEISPSVVSSSENGTGMGYTSMRIRGTDMTRINVTINGIPLNDAESQGVFWVNMSDFASSIEDVQIQRGVGTSTNGAASFGASINFQTLGISEKPYTNISSTVGSFGTFKENIVTSTGILDSCFSATIRFSKLNSQGWIKRGFSDHTAGHVTASYFTKKQLLTANIILGKEVTGITWWGVPDYMLETDLTYNPSGKYYDDNGNERYYNNETDNYWQNHYLLNYSYKLNSVSNVNLGLHYTQGKGYYQEYIAQFDDFGNENTFDLYGLNPIFLSDTFAILNNVVHVFPDSVINSSDMIRQKWLDNDFYGYTFMYNYKKNKIDFSFGNSYNQYYGNHFGKVKYVKFNPYLAGDHWWYFNVGEKTDFNTFAKIQFFANSKLSLFADVQVRTIKYSMSGPDSDLVPLNQNHTWQFINPKAGLFYKVNNSNSLFLSFAIAGREPSRADLKDAVKDLSGIFPESETLYDTEFGYTYKKKKLVVSTNVYYMLYDNQLVNTGKLNSVGYPIMTNVKESYRAGIELSAMYKPLDKIVISPNLTLSENKIRNYTE